MLDGLSGFCTVVECAPKPAHARVDFELNLEASTAVFCQGMAKLGVSKVAEGWHELPLQAGPQVFGVAEIAQEKDWGFEAGLSEL